MRPITPIRSADAKKAAPFAMKEAAFAEMFVANVRKSKVSNQPSWTVYQVALVAKSR